MEANPLNRKNQTKPRVEIVYKHRRERDRFYELPHSLVTSLPTPVQQLLNPRHVVKVRVTHDQRTGQELAKIIKARVADLDIYNPGAPLDCRISINMEMRYDGEVEGLPMSGDPSSRTPDRNKDRLSYTQSHYQVDLTQVVTVADVSFPSVLSNSSLFSHSLM
jgi:polynucleotide 5'-triphosphatase